MTICRSKNAQLSIIFLNGSHFPGALQDPSISLVLYHPLLHEIDAGLPQNKNVLFCQTFIVECNTSLIMSHKRLTVVSHGVIATQIDAWTLEYSFQ